MRDASPPLVLAFSGSVLCLRFVLAFSGSVFSDFVNASPNINTRHSMAQKSGEVWTKEGQD